MKGSRLRLAFASSMRVLALLLSLQIAGLGAIAEYMNDDVAHDTCANEENGRDCPPGCPSCTCQHGPVGSMPEPALPVAGVVASEAPNVTWTGADTELRSLADLPSVFRPPRA
jgi:hypothetical protein